MNREIWPWDWLTDHWPSLLQCLDQTLQTVHNGKNNFRKLNMDSQPYTIPDPGVYSQPPPPLPPQTHPPNVLQIVSSSGEPKHFYAKKYFLMILLIVSIFLDVISIFFVNASLAFFMTLIKTGTSDHSEEEIKGIQVKKPFFLSEIILKLDHIFFFRLLLSCCWSSTWCWRC